MRGEGSDTKNIILVTPQLLTMARSIIGAAAIIGVTLLAVVVLMSSEGVAGDGDVHYLDRLDVIDTDLTLANGTWNIGGSVHVKNGTLLLDNATVYLCLAQNPSIDIRETGHLESWNSQVYGIDNFRYFGVQGSISFHNSILGVYPRNHALRSMVTLEGSEVRFEDTTVVGWKITCQGSLVMSRCTFDSPYGIHAGEVFNRLRDPYSIKIDNTTFNASGDSRGAVSGYGGTNDQDVWELIIRDCNFGMCANGITIFEFFSNGTCLVENNRFYACRRGLLLDKVGSAVVIRDCIIDAKVGMYITIVIGGSPSIERLTIRAENNGLTLEDSKVTLVAWWWEVYSDTTAIEVLNSSLVLINSTIQGDLLDLSVTDGGSIVMVDCVHGNMVNTQIDGYVRATRRFDQVSLRWKDGPEISEGVTYIRDVNDVHLQTLVNSAIDGVNLTYWYVDAKTRSVMDQVVAVVFDHGTAFRSDLLSPLNMTMFDVEVVDYWTPLVVFTSHSDDDLVNSTSITLTGILDERGSGVTTASLRCNDGPWMELENPGGRWFEVTVTDLVDGSYQIFANVSDNCGNHKNGTVLRFVIDTVPPPINVIRPGHFVRMDSFLLEVETEPGCQAWIMEVPMVVDDLGRFSTFIDHIGGVMAIPIMCMDPAGNVNSTGFSVEMDNTPPLLVIDYPKENEWIGIVPFEVRGVCEEDARVMVDHLEAERNGPAFSFMMEANEGKVVILVVAVDPAGNEVSISVTAWVDLTPPEVVIEEPVHDAVVNETYLFMSGLVRDSNQVEVFVNGEPAPTLDGKWRSELVLDEGTNVIDVKAIDLAGNSRFIQIMVRCDKTPPQMNVELTQGDIWFDQGELTRTRLKEASIHIYLDEPCVVTVVGHVTRSLPRGSTDLNLSLTPNALTVIRVQAVDEAGNMAEEIVYRIEVDTLPPILEVDPMTGEDDIMTPGLISISGTTEPWAHLTVNGVPVPVALNGAFRFVVDVVEGPNEFELIATDDVGNSVNMTVSTFVSPFAGASEDGLGWSFYLFMVAIAVAAVAVVVGLKAWRRS